MRKHTGGGEEEEEEKKWRSGWVREQASEGIGGEER